MTKETKENTRQSADLIIVDNKRKLITVIFTNTKEVAVVPYNEILITGEIQK